MKALVAGGAGFIGSHLIDRLLESSYDVVCVDRLSFGSRNIQHLLSNEDLIKTGKFKFYHINLSDQDDVCSIFMADQIDVVYHMAANSDIQKSAQDPSIDFNDTFLTTRVLLEGMRNANVKNIFFSSTSAVYGEMPNVVLDETTGGVKPVSYYGGAKLASEALISSYTSMCNMNAVIFRFPNVIGPRLTHGVVFDFMEKLQNNPHELEILGDGTQCKPYIYVYDLINAIIQLTEKWRPGEEIFNISVESEGTTVTRIAEIVTQTLGLDNVLFKYTGGDRGWKGDVPYFKYDITKILSTGWKPRYTSDEAVQQTVRDAMMTKTQ